MNNELFIHVFKKRVEGREYIKLDRYTKKELYEMELFIRIVFLGESYIDAGMTNDKAWEEIAILIKALEKSAEKIEATKRDEIREILKHTTEISQAYSIFKNKIL